MSRAQQLRAIRHEADRRGWEIVGVHSDTGTGKSRSGRPGLDAAQEACRTREAEAIVAARLDRIARSVPDFGSLLEDARDRGYALVVLDHELDTSTANGRLVANVLASVAAWEREIISERTREALHDRIESGAWRPSKLSDADREYIVRAFTGDGLTVAEIARRLSRRCGRRVHRTSVANVLRASLGVKRGRLRDVAARS